MQIKNRVYIFGSAIITLTLLTLNVIAQSQNVIEGHFKALNSHDVKVIAAGYTADAQVFSPNWEGAKAGEESLKETYGRYFKSTPDLAYTVTNTIDAGDKVIVEYTWTGTLSNPEGGEPEYMKGKKYLLKACAIFELKGDKIAKETVYFDQVAFLKQVGFFDQH
ncbi:nuclear transport factor 2 family protein [Mucilaginibacter ginsenosidivorans]|uniref:Nuclear transport factor 2 family protein n=1 Tax=Mucilaginibacter ginsenosidivorans TaxID=398053 RepID=A0A5B8UX63_9SPHI|nr:nuclear transport factor 2 family protein [Mucilaginibacter ginsenosidivorans]QEC63529.1 nuclear transport factor 2 family protein [Mucilaginibacter ginsenosidivorans]